MEEKKNLLDIYRKDLALSNFNMRTSINSIEEWVKGNENQRNFKMRSEFEREKEYKLEEQAEIKNQIEQLQNNNINERLINHFNYKIDQQQELYNKYFEMREEINNKIAALKNALPELKAKVDQKREKLKQINKENLKLMQQISTIENQQLLNQSNINNISTLNNIQTNNLNNSNSSNAMLDKSMSNNMINIKELVEENESIREQYKRILSLKKELAIKRKQNEELSRAITEMNSDCFTFKKIFNEGMHEIAKELLKIHEIQLDKYISSSGNLNTSNNNNNQINSNSGNSLYFEIVKGNINGNEKKNDEVLKLPLINSNIRKKYNYPVVEKSNPTTLMYQVIKNMVDESHNLSKIVNMKKNKFTWDEFSKFSAYQIYTILNLNKGIIKQLEANLFPRKLIIPNIEDEMSSQLNSISQSGEVEEYEE